MLGKEKKQTKQPSLSERLAQWLEQMGASWQGALQTQQPQAADTQGKRRRRIWEYHSPDGLLRGVAVLSFRGDVTFRFTSKDMALAGSRFVLRWGKCRREVALRQASATEARAKVVILSHERPDDLSTLIVFTVAEVAE